MKSIKNSTKFVLSWVTTLILVPTTYVLAEGAVGFTNPLKVNTLAELLEALLSIILVLLTPIIVFFIIYAGFLYVTAQGNSTKVEEATKALTYAVIGGVIVLGSFAIISIVKDLVDSFM